jgi:hypothetical protein
MADSNRLSDGERRRAQIIAGQALREASAAPTDWRAKRKRRSFTNWNAAPAAPSQPQPQAAEARDAPTVKT